MDILKEKVNDYIVIEMFREFPFIVKMDDLKKELISTENYNKTITVESIAWAFYKTNAKMFNYKIDNQDKIDKVIGMLQGRSIYSSLDKPALADIIDREYIRVTIDSKTRNIPVAILEFFIHDDDNYQNIANVFKVEKFNDRYQESSYSFLSKNNYMFKNYIAYLIRAYQELYKLLIDKNYDFSNDDNIKLSLLNKFLSFNQLTKEKIDVIYKNVMINVSEEMVIKDIRAKEDIFLSSTEEIKIISQISEFLSNYQGDELVKDTYNYLESISNKVYDNNFYILFIKIMTDVYKDNMYFSDDLVRNVNEIFYDKALDEKYQTDFHLQFKEKSWIPEKFVYAHINPEIYDYIDKNLPKDITDELERDIAIYILLVSKFRHNREFVIYEDMSLSNDVSSIDLSNNEVVCWDISLMYYKILQKYNSDVDLYGIFGLHVHINFIADNIPLSADPVSFRIRSDFYQNKLSDMTKVQFGMEVSNIRLIDDDYFNRYRYLSLDDISRIMADDQHRLDKAIENVYKKLGKNYVKEEDFINLVNTYNNNTKKRLERHNQIKGGNIYHTKEDIDYRISTINYFYNMNIKKNNIEKIQFMTKYVNMIFSDFNKEDFNLFNLFQDLDDNKTKMLKLISVKDSDKQEYFYLEEDGGFHEYNKDDLIYLMFINNINLRTSNYDGFGQGRSK